MSQEQKFDKRGESTDERLLGLFTVTGIAPSTVWTLPNQYWPDSEHYAEVRRKNPWLLVKTQWGLIQIGWRKRVIEIDWSDTAIRGEVTADDVTKSTVQVHAWSYEKAVEYLIAWRKLAETTLSHEQQNAAPAGEIARKQDGVLAHRSTPPAGAAPSTTPCIEIPAEGSGELRKALDIILKLASIINGTPAEAFKGWSMGERKPYELAMAAEAFVAVPRVITGTTAAASAASARRQSIKGVRIDGGYVIVTPAGKGPEPARNLMAQIFELFPVGKK